MTMPETLVPFIPANKQLTRLVRDFLIATLPDETAIKTFIALPADKKHALAMDIADGKKTTAAALEEFSFDQMMAMREAEIVNLAPSTVDRNIARAMRDTLRVISATNPQEPGYVVAGPEGLAPDIAKGVFYRLAMTVRDCPKAIPLLEAEFRRAAKRRDLALPSATLVNDVKSGELRLLGTKPTPPSSNPVMLVNL